MLGDLDGSLVDQFVQVQLWLLLLLFLLSLLLEFVANSREVGVVAIESILHTLLQQGLLGVQFVVDLELGQLHLHVLLLLIAIVQKLFQLLTVLDLLLFNLSQTVPGLWHDDVHGQFLLLSRNADHSDLLIFEVVESALALDSLALFRLLASQRMEDGSLGHLLLTELLSPFGVQLQGADGNHLGVVCDGGLRENALHLLASLGRDQAVDLLTALLRVGLE